MKLSHVRTCVCSRGWRSQALLEATGAKLVIHTAGPFQRSKNYAVLEAAIASSTGYIDVCDDTAYAEG
jgi:hypothetical protein